MQSVSTIHWRVFPLMRVLLGLLPGIGLGWYARTMVAWPIVVTLLALLVLGLTFWASRSLRWSYNRWWGIVAMGVFCLLGYVRTQQNYELDQTSHFAQQAAFVTGDSLYWQGRVVSVRPSGDRLRTVLAIDDMANSTARYSCDGQLLVYLPAEAGAAALLAGQSVQLYAAVERLAAPLNPDVFDFSLYQARRNVFHQTRIGTAQWRLIDETPSLRGHAQRWRERLLAILHQYLPTGSNELAVGAALLLGKRDLLTTDLRNAYAETGAVHVLAVSGLHLGFVAYGLGWLLSFGPLSKRRWRWLKLVLVLAGIWAFTLLTGMSASVMRAATMFSFLWIGKTINQRMSIYNSLAASAVVLLLINPYLLFDIGFQLSYLALVGIIYFQPRLYRLWFPPNRLADYAWKMTTVALAAQLTTFPITLYYFHQFPLYFLVSGLVVVLMAELILGLGIALFIFSWWEPLAALLGTLLEWALWFNNGFVHWVRALPGHLLNGIWIGELLFACLLLSIFLLARFWANWQASFLVASLASLLLGLGAHAYGQYQLSQQRSWTIYQQYKASVIDAFDGQHRYSLATVPENDPGLAWSAQPHRERRAVQAWPDSLQALHWYNGYPVYGFYEQKVLIVDKDWQAPTDPPEPLGVDLVMLRQSPWVKLSELSTYVQSEHWIADGSNYPSRVGAWQTEAEALNLHWHYTARDGAFAKDF